MLNALWLFFFFIAYAAAGYQWCLLGDAAVFGRLLDALFGAAKNAFELSLGLAGMLALWLGVMRVGERSGLVAGLTRGLTPLFRRLAPSIPADHPALGAMTMNIAANLLGLDNAATPLGIKAMRALQTLNPHPTRASNPQILFLVLNSSSLTLFPVSIINYRAQLGAAQPSDVFIPILLATSASTLMGFVAVCLCQRIKCWDPIIAIYVGGLVLSLGGLLLYCATLDSSRLLAWSSQTGPIVLFSLIVLFFGVAAWRRVDAYAAFIDGAQEGFQTAVTLIPYLVAMLCAIAVLRASGVFDAAVHAVGTLAMRVGSDGRFVEALPVALLKPFSGSGARAMMIDAMQTHGADSFTGRLACVLQGSTETTFYVIAVYYGAAGVRHIRHTLVCALAADAAGIIAAFFVADWFFA